MHFEYPRPCEHGETQRLMGPPYSSHASTSCSWATSGGSLTVHNPAHENWPAPYTFS